MAVWIDFSIGVHLARRSVMDLGPIMASFWLVTLSGVSPTPSPSSLCVRRVPAFWVRWGRLAVFASYRLLGLLGLRSRSLPRVGEGSGEGSGEGDIGRWRTSLLTEGAIDV